MVCDDCGSNFPVSLAPPVYLTFPHSSLTHQHQQLRWVAKGKYNGQMELSWDHHLAGRRSLCFPAGTNSSLWILTCHYIIPAASYETSQNQYFTSFHSHLRMRRGANQQGWNLTRLLSAPKMLFQKCFSRNTLQLSTKREDKMQTQHWG